MIKSNRIKIIPENNKTIENDKTIDQMKKCILGKTYNEAIKVYANLRIVKKDDKKITITLNYCQERCNVVMKNNIIIDIDGFY